MYRNLFLILTQVSINDIFKIKITNSYYSKLFIFCILSLVIYLTRNTEFSIFSEELTVEKITLWVSLILSISSNHDINKK